MSSRPTCAPGTFCGTCRGCVFKTAPSTEYGRSSTRPNTCANPSAGTGALGVGAALPPLADWASL
eukprot:13860307-Alexandrium_andersonii.AAC.1